MGPKGKSRKKGGHLKNITELSKVTREISKMEVGLNELNCKLASLTLEFNNKSKELFARQLDLD